MASCLQYKSFTDQRQTFVKGKMSNSAEVSIEAETAFQRMPVEPETDDQGMLEIYRKMMLIDLFQTHYGGWISNLPVHLKFFMVAMMLLLLTGILAFGGVFFAQLHWDKIKKKMTDLMETLSAIFSYEPEAPVKVLTVKDGTRDHEFFED